MLAMPNLATHPGYHRPAGTRPPVGTLPPLPIAGLSLAPASESRGRHGIPTTSCLSVLLCRTATYSSCHDPGGPGCKRGAGQQFRAALLRQGKAADDLRRAEGDIPDLEAQIKAANDKRDGAVAAFRAREPQFLEAAQAIDKRVADEAVPPRNDPVMSYMALQQVLNAPDGEGARFFAHLMMALLLTVELSYVIVSEYFSHASIYMARLIARTKILAAQAADEYRHAAGGLFSPKGGRAAYRVVPRFEKSRSDAA